MSNLADIDATRPMTVYPCRKHAGIFWRPVAPTVDLPAEFTPAFIQWLQSHGWSRHMETVLQSFSLNDQGEELLTTWLSVSEFEQLLDEAQELRELDPIRDVVREWTAKRADDVFIDGVWKDPPEA